MNQEERDAIAERIAPRVVARRDRMKMEEYLRSTWHPDRDFVDGRLEERNLGEYDHSRLQGALMIWFAARKKEWQIIVLPEIRVRVRPERCRIADIAVIRADAPRESVLTQALVVIEILSPEDRLGRYQERINDYLKLGVENVWILDPESRKAWVATPGNLREETARLEVQGTGIQVPLPGIFEED
jgi:Uma2 family endonuclease